VVVSAETVALAELAELAEPAAVERPLMRAGLAISEEEAGAVVQVRPAEPVDAVVVVPADLRSEFSEQVRR
jgi:hypothetical protein